MRIYDDYCQTLKYFSINKEVKFWIFQKKFIKHGGNINTVELLCGLCNLNIWFPNKFACGFVVLFLFLRYKSVCNLHVAFFFFFFVKGLSMMVRNMIICGEAWNSHPQSWPRNWENVQLSLSGLCGLYNRTAESERRSPETQSKGDSFSLSGGFG